MNATDRLEGGGKQEAEPAGQDAAARDPQGVLYISTGREHVRRALRSAASVRRHNPTLPIHLMTDLSESEMGAMHEGPISSWERIADAHRRSKVDCLSRTPFQRTLYLDSDTRVLCPLEDLFRILERFDVAVAHAPRRARGERLPPVRLDLPRAWARFNGGVILYRDSAPTMRFLDTWRQWFHEAGLPWDQRTLREALWASDVRLAVLPPEYNIRSVKYLMIWSRDEARPKILHLPYFKNGPRTYFDRWWRRQRRRLLRRMAPMDAPHR